MKLGKGLVRHDERTLHLSNYLKGLPATPISKTWYQKVTNLGFKLNDEIGDCTVACEANIIQTWTANMGKQVIIPDPVILTEYEALSGYDPTTGANDNGAVVLDVLNRWRNVAPLNGHRLAAYNSVDPKNRPLVQVGVMLFEALYAGFRLPTTAQNQKTWDVVPGMVPGSWGGHAVPIVGYGKWALCCFTWGALKWMSWPFFFACCDELYAPYSNDMLKPNGLAPNNFNRDLLLADLQLV